MVNFYEHVCNASHIFGNVYAFEMYEHRHSYQPRTAHIKIKLWFLKNKKCRTRHVDTNSICYGF